MEKGLVQVYTGNGKGKTTAALGLALRAAGQGLRVGFVQFLKPADFETGELIAIRRWVLPIDVKHFGGSKVWGAGKPKKQITDQMRLATHEALGFAAVACRTGKYDVLVLDEMLTALSSGLLELPQVLDLVKTKAKSAELVLTGRAAPQEIIDAADLVTEMKETKHPHQAGIIARKGIEY